MLRIFGTLFALTMILNSTAHAQEKTCNVTKLLNEEREDLLRKLKAPLLEQSDLMYSNGEIFQILLFQTTKEGDKLYFRIGVDQLDKGCDSYVTTSTEENF